MENGWRIACAASAALLLAACGPEPPKHAAPASDAVTVVFGHSGPLTGSTAHRRPQGDRGGPAQLPLPGQLGGETGQFGGQRVDRVELGGDGHGHVRTSRRLSGPTAGPVRPGR